jgi:small subunit ribosomal protein S1
MAVEPLLTETENDDDFAALFEASQQTRRIKNGQSIEGTIVAIGSEVAFVNVGGKGEATIQVAELKNDDGVLQFAVGDRIQATVMLTPDGLTLSRKLQRGAASSAQIEDAFRAGLPVEGKVDKAVKAGFEVRVAGLRAFCPNSQIDIARDTDPASHIGRVYTFKIVDYSEGGQKFVVSRRALLEQDQAARAIEVRKSIEIGSVITGRVVSVRDFGAFIDLGGGVQGLLHVSEMGWSRTTDPSQFVKPGEEITVKVLRIDDDKIALGLKQLSDDPWSTVSSTFSVGQVVQGRVTRLAEFGAFVELADGIEGLAHASSFGQPGGQSGGRPGGRAGWAKSVKTGMVAPFEILSIDPVKKRIGVAIVEPGAGKSRATAAKAAEAEEAADVRDYTARENVAQADGFGSLADKLRGALKPPTK